MTKKGKWLFFSILFLGFFLRTLNLNWDQNQHLHPDERFLTMVGLGIKFPSTLKEYFDPSISPLNPYNHDCGFFVYGTFPLNLVKFLAEKAKLADYNRFTLTGRTVSSFFEVGTLILVFLTGQEVFKSKKDKWRSALWAMFFYALSVLPIQLAHFFAVETFLVFFTSFSFYLLFRFINNSPRLGHFFYPLLIGVSTGLALACKATAVLGTGIILLGLGLKRNPSTSRVKLKHKVLSILIFSISAYLFLRIGDPRIFSSGNFLNFSPNPQFINNLKQLASFNNPDSLFPPGIQWIKTRPLAFPLKNMILWGWGLPLGLIVVVSVFYTAYIVIPDLIRNLYRSRIPGLAFGLPRAGKCGMTQKKEINLFLILLFVLITFFYQGTQFAKAMRYFYPIYPFLAILAGFFACQIFDKVKKKINSKFTFCLLFSVFCFLILLYPFSFISIYTHPHSRMTASHWIYKNIPAGSTISCEYWDDCLPLGLGRKSSSLYQTETLTLYDQDTPQKWSKINQQLKNIDYLILSSNRLWGSISKVPEVYPQASQYYQKLFKEELGFKKMADFTSYPCFPPVGKAVFCLPDQSADESFTVYDHPQVMIFKKSNQGDFFPAKKDPATDKK
jgi:hypothetical protein